MRGSFIIFFLVIWIFCSCQSSNIPTPEEARPTRVSLPTLTPTRTSMIIGLPTAQVPDADVPYGVVTVGGSDGLIPSEWRTPPNIDPRYELTTISSTFEVGRCQYSSTTPGSNVGGEVVRMRKDIEMVLTDLVSGEVLAHQQFPGESPAPCPEIEFFRESRAVNYNWGVPDEEERRSWVMNTLGDRDDLPVPAPVLYGYQFSAARYSPDGTMLVTTSSHQTAPHLWDAATGEELLVFEDVPDRTCHPSFSPDGSLLVTGACSIEADDDGVARVWDVATGEELLQLVGHKGQVRSAEFSPDGQTIVTAGTDDFTVRIWDAVTGEELRRFDVDAGEELLRLIADANRVYEAVFGPDGRFIAFAGTPAQIWDTHTGETQPLIEPQHEGEAERLPRTTSDVAFSPDDSLIVTSSENLVFVWDAQNGEVLFKHFVRTGDVLDVGFSPDGRLVIAGIDGLSGHGGHVYVWDAHTGDELYKIVGHSGRVCSVAFSPDGSTILTASDRDNTVRFWELPSLAVSSS